MTNSVETACSQKKARAAVGRDGQPRALTEEFGEAPLSSGVSEQGLTPVEHEQEQGEHDQDEAGDHLQFGRGCSLGQADRIGCGGGRSSRRRLITCIGMTFAQLRRCQMRPFAEHLNRKSVV